MSGLRVTPFHSRAAEANCLNAWENRNGFTLAAFYSDVAEEALAARFGCAMVDLSWHWCTEISGARAGEFAARLFTRDVTGLAPGEAAEALWLDDAGMLRGLGTVTRRGTSFLLQSATADGDWIAQAGALFDVTLRESTDAILALIGPTAGRVLRAAGINADLAPMQWRRLSWRGLEIAVSRFGSGFELWCQPDDAAIAWDRLCTAGGAFALRPAGQQAMDILDVESGTARAVSGMTPQDAGLAGLVDPAHAFNGRAGLRAAGRPSRLAGLVFDSEETVPAGTPLSREGRPAGRILRCLVSPAMRTALAIAILPPDVDGPLLAAGRPCRTVSLPILPIPAPIPTDTPAPAV